jgi:hypothetical protein
MAHIQQNDLNFIKVNHFINGFYQFKTVVNYCFLHLLKYYFYNFKIYQENFSYYSMNNCRYRKDCFCLILVI